MLKYKTQDEMDDIEDDGCDVVCDVFNVMLCGDVVWWFVWWWCVVMLCGDVVCDGVGDVVCDGVSGAEGSGKVEWLMCGCLGVLMTDEQMDGHCDWKMGIF